MTGIGHCEVKKCGNRTSKRFCSDHRNPSDRKDLLLVGESKPFSESLPGRLLLRLVNKF